MSSSALHWLGGQGLGLENSDSLYAYWSADDINILGVTSLQHSFSTRFYWSWASFCTTLRRGVRGLPYQLQWSFSDATFGTTMLLGFSTGIKLWTICICRLNPAALDTSRSFHLSWYARKRIKELLENCGSIELSWVFRGDSIQCRCWRHILQVSGIEPIESIANTQSIPPFCSWLTFSIWRLYLG
jgi:hypothetical protein